MVSMFGYLLAAAVIGTSLAMLILGRKWQAIEHKAYGEEKRPWWFWIISAVVFGLYVYALIEFITFPKNWASWILMVMIPVGWGAKAALIFFNKEGRETVSNISGDESWGKIALARLPVALILGLLAFFAL
jgi:energy-converting hydrogenase Eha subunit G